MSRIAAAALVIACFFAVPAAAQDENYARTRLNTLACEVLPFAP